MMTVVVATFVAAGGPAALREPCMVALRKTAAELIAKADRGKVETERQIAAARESLARAYESLARAKAAAAALKAKEEAGRRKDD